MSSLSWRNLTAALLFACLLLTGAASAAGIEAVYGDTIPLSGYSPTSNTVYLFLTGPNLPANGVALNDITKRADEGGFTVVQVDGMDDSWSYKWHTSNINGHLDEGTYTVWVVNQPFDRSNLQNADYGTIAVTLGSPGLSASVSSSIGTSTGTAPAVPAGIAVTSDPTDASVTVDGQYRGKTPVTIDDVDPGTHAVQVTKFGYAPYAVSVTLRSGEEADIRATLPAERGMIVVNTTPPGAQVLLDGSVAGISPLTLPAVLPGNHTITVAKAGYANASQQVGVTAGGTSPLEMTLSPLSPIPGLRTPGLTVTALLALCVAAVTIRALRPR